MASFSVPCPKISPTLSKRRSVALIGGSHLQCGRVQSDSFKTYAQLTEVSVEKTSNGSPAIEPLQIKKPESTLDQIPDPSSISALMTQVADLAKLVDSRDIAELQLKQMGCEIVIRKKEALPPQPAFAALANYGPPPMAVPPPPQLPAASVPSAPSSPQKPAAPAKPKSSHPPFKSPMSGTFYRSPAPGVPPFVKAGDKVQKGQVICIIEAMKLMNEIEADLSGTIVEILAEDGKTVSLDLPLFIIEP